MNGVEFLLDTNVVIGLLKGHDAAVSTVEASGLDLSKAAISQITRMELLSFSALSEREESEIKAFIGCCQVLMLDEVVEAQAIQLRKGGSLKLPDAIVASTAMVHGLRLLTLDQRLSASLRAQPK
jgi:predicted nucleic acid-binding protein